jgi:Fe-S oxidoreductase
MDALKIEELKNTINNGVKRPSKYYLDLCTRCGLCYDSCHVYNGIPIKEYSPVGRAEVVRRIYKKYFTMAGRFFPSWGEATGIDDHVMDDLLQAAFSCTGCRRCMMYCPFGIDTPQILALAKLMLIENGTAPEELVMLADGAVEKGKMVDEFKGNFKEVIKDLEKEVARRLGLSDSDGLIPLEKKNADILFVALSGAASIVNPATILTRAGADWTLSYFEAVNFGQFLGDPGKMKTIANRYIREAADLNVKEIVIVECGTAFRIPKYLLGKLPFKITSMVELIHRYVKEEKIKVKERAITEPVTYHDPCQIGRNAGIYDEPRETIRLLAKDFREMTPNREYNWCCGGGGGLGALDNEEFRIKSGKPKKEQIDATGARIVVSACENCISQLNTIKSGYGLDIEVKSLTELVAGNLA